MNITVKANAKINCYLKITGADERGYHLLKMRNVSVDIFDTVKVSVREGLGTEVEFLNDKTLNATENTAFKAAQDFRKNFPQICDGKKICIEVEKGIPVGAGLGGSSADAAAVLFGLCKLFNIQISEVSDIAKKIGSDVPFMLFGGNAVVEGIGEKISRQDFKDTFFVVAKPFGGVSTALCYKSYDELSDCEKELNVSFSNEKFDTEFGYKPFNSLTIPAMKINADIAYIFDFFKMEKADAVFLTGSGSAVCAWFDSKENAKKSLKALKHNEKIEFAVIANTTKNGIETE